ncbi:MAG TPA: dethiobiotin synthase [Puia sp.]
MRPFFISGIGTGIGKTVVAAVLTEAMKSDYWKPVQAGFTTGTDSSWLASLINNSETIIHPETYKLQMAASPHIAAKKESRRIVLSRIVKDFHQLNSKRLLIIEGAGGLMVPLNEKEFVIDLVKQLDARLILVSRNYLGSINHSLMTAKLCRSYGLEPAGWVFNDNYLDYEREIVDWSGYPALFSLPLMDSISQQTISQAAGRIDLSYLYSLL